MPLHAPSSPELLFTAAFFLAQSLAPSAPDPKSFPATLCSSFVALWLCSFAVQYVDLWLSYRLIPELSLEKNAFVEAGTNTNANTYTHSGTNTLTKIQIQLVIQIHFQRQIQVVVQIHLQIQIQIQERFATLIPS